MQKSSKRKEAINPKGMAERAWVEDYLKIFNELKEHEGGGDYLSRLRDLLEKAAVHDLPRRIAQLHAAQKEMFPPKDEYLFKYLYLSEREIANVLIHRLGEIRATEERRTEEEHLLTDITDSIISSLDIKDIFRVITTKIHKLVDFDRASIVLVDETHGSMVAYILATESNSNYQEGFQEGVFPLKRTAQEWVLRHRKSCIDQDLKNQRFRENGGLYSEGFRSSIRVPLLYRGKIIGTLNLDSSRTGAFGPVECSLLEQVSGQVAIAIENSQLYEEALRRATEVASINSSLGKIVREQTAKVKELEKEAGDHDWIACT